MQKIAAISESLAVEVRHLRLCLEDMEDLMELRLAVERNAGKPGTLWDHFSISPALIENHAAVSKCLRSGMALPNNSIVQS